MNIFENFDSTHLQVLASWFAIIYLSMLVAMTVDLFTGVRKASLNGEATTSRGFRRTTEKAMLYLLPMLCLTCIDIITSVFLEYPFFTASMAVFNIYIELRSVWENTHTNSELIKKKKCAEDLEEFIRDHKEEIVKYIFKV